MKTRIAFFCLFSVIFILSSCKKDEKTCNVNATSDPITQGLTVIYTVTISGDATLESVTYRTAHGDTTINNPSQLFFAQADLSAGMTASVSATAKMKDGSVEVNYQGNDGGYMINGRDECSQN